MGLALGVRPFWLEIYTLMHSARVRQGFFSLHSDLYSFLHFYVLKTIHLFTKTGCLSLVLRCLRAKEAKELQNLQQATQNPQNQQEIGQIILESPPLQPRILLRPNAISSEQRIVVVVQPVLEPDISYSSSSVPSTVSFSSVAKFVTVGHFELSAV